MKSVACVGQLVFEIVREHLRTPPDIRLLTAAMRALAHDRLGTGYAIAVGPVEALANAPLFPSEISLVAGAGPLRLKTFRSGRACAREALKELGQEPSPIFASSSGSPIWPTAVVGSISHTDEVAAAVVAHSPPVKGLGLDLESDEPLDHEAMVRLICRPEELNGGIGVGDPINRRRGKLLFVVKEAVYKVYRPLHHAFLDFQDLKVSLDEGGGTFVAHLLSPNSIMLAEGQSFSGNFGNAEGFFFAISSQTSLSYF